MNSPVTLLVLYLIWNIVIINHFLQPLRGRIHNARPLGLTGWIHLVIGSSLVVTSYFVARQSLAALSPNDFIVMHFGWLGQAVVVCIAALKVLPRQYERTPYWAEEQMRYEETHPLPNLKSARTSAGLPAEEMRKAA